MSDVLTKNDFYTKAMQSLSSYPALAARVQAGDVTITQQIGAISHMLAELSWQIGVGEVEPWTKARDSMVLAEATAKGIMPYASAPKWSVNIKNNSDVSNTISAGRRLLDNKGKTWVVTDGLTILPGELGAVTVEQRESKVISHEVTIQGNFYQIEIPPLDLDQYLISVDVVRSSDQMKFKKVERFNNVEPNELVYHIGADETMRLWVEFGLAGVAGYIPMVGEKFEIILHYTQGPATLESAAPFSFEYSYNTDVDRQTELFALSMVFSGGLPFSIPEMREMVNFPSLHDENAVFLSEYQFLITRHLSPFVFLSVWNEELEEDIRGANVANINHLFVSFIKSGADVTEIQARIREIVRIADNSLRVKFVDTAEKTIPMTINLRLSSLHDEESVKAKIRDLILLMYGRNSVFARRGRVRINWQATAKKIKESIVELQDNVSDFSLMVDEDDSKVKPEEFRYVSVESLSINNTPLKSY